MDDKKKNKQELVNELLILRRENNSLNQDLVALRVRVITSKRDRAGGKTYRNKTALF